MHFPLGKITIFEVSSIEEISRFKKQLMKRRVENSLKIPMFLAIDFIKKSNKIQPKIRSPHAHPKKYQKSRFWDHFGLPKPSQNPSKTEVRKNIDFFEIFSIGFGFFVMLETLKILIFP